MIGYELLSYKLTGQVNLMQDDLDMTTMAVLDRLLALGGFDPGVDGKITIKRYCNLAEDPHREKKEKATPMCPVCGGEITFDCASGALSDLKYYFLRCGCEGACMPFATCIMTDEYKEVAARRYGDYTRMLAEKKEKEKEGKE